MDEPLKSWLDAVDARSEETVGLFERGETVMRSEPSAPAVIVAEAYCRLAGLAAELGWWQSADRYSGRAIELGLDLPVEGQLSVLPRAVAVASAAARAAPDVSPLARDRRERAIGAIDTAAIASVDALDRDVTQLATALALRDALGSSDDARRALTGGIDSLRSRFEAVGELAIVDAAEIDRG